MKEGGLESKKKRLKESFFKGEKLKKEMLN